MGNVIMMIRVMPAGVDVNLDELAEKVRQSAPENTEIRDIGIKPIAFGLKALMVATVTPDEGNIGEEFASKLQSIEGVESVTIESVELL